MTTVYFVYLESYISGERISIGIFSSYDKAKPVAIRAAEYWNGILKQEYLFKVNAVELDRIPDYL